MSIFKIKLQWYTVQICILYIIENEGRVRADETMNKLKTVYGNMSEQYLQVMKIECRQQVRLLRLSSAKFQHFFCISHCQLC